MPIFCSAVLIELIALTADCASIQAINEQIKNVDDLLTGGVGKIVGVIQGGGGKVSEA